MWFLTSIYLAKTGNGDLFARMGSVSVALALIYFGLLSRPMAAPYGYHKQNALNAKIQDKNSRGVGLALARTTLLAHSFKVLAKSKDKELSPEIESMLGPLDHAKAVVARDELAEHLSFVQKIDAGESQAEYLDASANSVSVNLRRTEVFVAFVGTLQWGFGDLFFMSERLP